MKKKSQETEDTLNLTLTKLIFGFFIDVLIKKHDFCLPW